MKTIRHTTTLYYYDGPQVFEARDACGGRYIATMIEQAELRDRYLVVEVEPGRLCQFRLGALDLRALLLERGADEWFLTSPTGGLDAPFVLEPQSSALASSRHLPDDGFILDDRLSSAPAPPNALARKSTNHLNPL
jgi:hypothetical protein